MYKLYFEGQTTKLQRSDVICLETTPSGGSLITFMRKKDDDIHYTPMTRIPNGDQKFLLYGMQEMGFRKFSALLAAAVGLSIKEITLNANYEYFEFV